MAEGEAEIEAALVSTAAPLAGMLVVGAAAGGLAVVAVVGAAGVDLAEVSTGVELAEVVEEAGTAAVGIVMSKGGLYSKVPVRSSIILIPYLSPSGIFVESSNVLGTVHVYAPEFAAFASQR